LLKDSGGEKSLGDGASFEDEQPYKIITIRLRKDARR